MPVVPFLNDRRSQSSAPGPGPSADPVFYALGAGIAYQQGRLFSQADAMDRPPTDPGNPADELHPNKLPREKDPHEITTDSGKVVDYDTKTYSKPLKKLGEK